MKKLCSIMNRIETKDIYNKKMEHGMVSRKKKVEWNFTYTNLDLEEDDIFFLQECLYQYNEIYPLKRRQLYLIMEIVIGRIFPSVLIQEILEYSSYFSQIKFLNFASLELCGKCNKMHKNPNQSNIQILIDLHHDKKNSQNVKSEIIWTMFRTSFESWIYPFLFQDGWIHIRSSTQLPFPVNKFDANYKDLIKKLNSSEQDKNKKKVEYMFSKWKDQHDVLVHFYRHYTNIKIWYYYPKTNLKWTSRIIVRIQE